MEDRLFIVTLTAARPPGRPRWQAPGTRRCTCDIITVTTAHLPPVTRCCSPEAARASRSISGAGIWRSLGIYPFAAGSLGSVMVTSAGITRADAVRFEPALIVDNTDSGF